MVEYHGWVTIQLSAQNVEIDDSDEKEAQVTSNIREYIAKVIAPTFTIMDIRQMNWQTYIWVAGNTNHRSQDIQDVFDLYAHISSVAPGSYGILYMHDDEEIGFENEFRVYVLIRRNLTAHKDPFLSPYFPVVEDMYNG
jgi:Immunity protein 7